MIFASCSPSGGSWAFYCTTLGALHVSGLAVAGALMRPRRSMQCTLFLTIATVSRPARCTTVWPVFKRRQLRQPNCSLSNLVASANKRGHLWGCCCCGMLGSFSCSQVSVETMKYRCHKQDMQLSQHSSAAPEHLLHVHLNSRCFRAFQLRIAFPSFHTVHTPPSFIFLPFISEILHSCAEQLSACVCKCSDQGSSPCWPVLLAEPKKNPQKIRWHLRQILPSDAGSEQTWRLQIRSDQERALCTRCLRSHIWRTSGPAWVLPSKIVQKDGGWGVGGGVGEGEREDCCLTPPLPGSL